MAREVELYQFSVKTGFNASMVHEIISLMGQKTNVTVLDRDSIFSHLHLASAVMHAARSIVRGKARARAEPLEIMRWLTGSHQVLKGIDIAGPNENTTNILVLRTSEDWPNDDDMDVLPKIREEVWKGSIPNGLVPISTPFELGGETAIERMGMSLISGYSKEDMEKAVLEAVCSLSLK
jgi:tRNA threonylcarbamoyladenosine modification (KEOPS) complex Cgi121 subunit